MALPPLTGWLSGDASLEKRERPLTLDGDIRLAPAVSLLYAKRLLPRACHGRHLRLSLRTGWRLGMPLTERRELVRHGC